MYYKGNNIGLNYDAATGTWSFENTPNDFIDTESFSSVDPKFDYVPPEDTTPDEPDDDPCPEGYIYDSELKQCVPDPNYQNPFANTNQSSGGQDITPQRIAGTDRTTTDGNFRATDDEYNKMTASELVENYKQRGFIKTNDKGELVIDFNRVGQGGKILDSLLGRFTDSNESQASINKVINYLLNKNIVNQSDIYMTDDRGGTGNYTFNNEVVIPTIAKFEADYYGIPYSDVIAPGFGDKIFGTKESVQQFDDYMANKLKAFSTVANNAVNSMPPIMYQNYSASAGDSGEAFDKASDLANIERRKKEAEARAAEIKAEKERIKLADELDAMMEAKDKEREVQERIKDKKIEERKKVIGQTGGAAGSGNTGTSSSNQQDTNAPNYPGNVVYSGSSGSGSSGTGQSGGFAGSGITSNPKPKDRPFYDRF